MPAALTHDSPVGAAPTLPAKRTWWKSLVYAFTALLLLFLTAYMFRAPLLTGLANAWIINDLITNADAIVVLGGRPDLRPVEAARLFHHGVAPKILYPDVKTNPVGTLGLAPTEPEITRRMLMSNAVPEAAMELVGHQVNSTYDESRAVRAWLTTNSAKSVLIVTDLSHTRRARWIFRRELEGTGAQAYVHATKLPEYGVKDWWRHEDGLIAFQNEALKSIYYWFKY